jgi:predicted acyltransferase
MSSAAGRARIPDTELPAQPARLVSLDAFRGAIILFMVLVNNGGGPENYHQLTHSAWDGWTATDVVFPSFLWIVGVAITLSLGKRMASGASRAVLFRQVLRRSAILFLLGVCLYLPPEFHFAGMRILGVLQRIAICYLAASAIYLTTGLRGQIGWIVGLMSGYWALMFFVPVPGYGAGHLDLQRNLAHFVDRAVLGPHNYREGDWDPEGIVSTLPAIASTLFGIMAGHILRMRRVLAERTTWLFFAGAVLTLAGVVVNHWMPINKKLWSDSFVLFMAGLDFTMFAAFAWLIDGVKFSRWTKPFTVVGMNAIAIYLFSEALSIVLDWTDAHEWVFDNLFNPIASPRNASLLFALSFVGVTWVFGWALYKRGWFWKI